MPTYNDIVFKSTGTICTINNRVYTKDRSGFALCGVIKTSGGYTTAFIVSPDSDVCHFTWSGYGSGDVGVGGSTVINGTTWYYTNAGAGWQNATASGTYTVMAVNGGSELQGCTNMAGYYYDLVSKLVLSVSPSGTGTVSASGTTDITDYFVTGTDVTLTATPNSGYRFAKWSNDSTSNPYTFAIAEATSLTATFKHPSCHIKVNGSWKYGTVYIKANGTWKEGTIKVKNGTWKDAT